MSSGLVYLIEPLPFGGIMAFDPEFVYLYFGKKQGCTEAKKLRRSMMISSIIMVDKYNPQTGRTDQGSNLLRYLAGTESGELYMIAFNLALVQVHLGISKKSNHHDPEAQLVCVEFLGARLSSCSSLLYLNDGLLYYSSNSGDSYLLKIKSE